MSAVIPFNFSAPAVVRSQERRVSKINQEAMIGGASFPVISIKGKVFTLVKDNERKVLTRNITDDDGNVETVAVASLPLAVVRANTKSRVYYAGAYVEGDSEGAKPTCFSHDSVAPDASSESAQANKCALCPHAVWGSKASTDGKEAKGTACTVNTRLAVVDPKYPVTEFLLRVPAGSRVNFNDAVKLADSHGYDYNTVVMKIAFDNEAPSPKLIFTPTGLLGDEVKEKVAALFEDPRTLDIVGRAVPRTTGESDGAAGQTPEQVAADALAKAAKPTPKPDPKPEPAAEKPKAEKPKVKPAPVDDDEGLGGLGGAAEEPVAEKPAEKPKATKPKAEKPVAPAGDVAADLMGELGALLANKDD